ncbi:hypothetical protein CASFOL_042149 [Castilleja foliolosa]|uniref:BHLH domain-containing protein n=1 Tax=Castilleja foliolosa TaxID=1961234 RepID=A0ABD3B9N8_9LAMI
MLHSLNTNSKNNTEMSVLERQRFRLKLQQEQSIQHQPITFFNENVIFSSFNGDQGFGEFLIGGALKSDPGLETGLNDGFRSVLSYGNGSELNVAAAANMAQEQAQSSGAASTESSKKRKADKTQNPKVNTAEKSDDKRMKGCKEDEYKTCSSKSTTTTVANNKNTKDISENPKPDYIHVRARRGQATDSHSLAERVRREKISEKMKFLQDLVPGCNKITGKAGMLDEIINYVQSLQTQVEFLSMKLAVINPRLDFDGDNNYLVKEMYPGCTSSDIVNHNHGPFEFNTLGQGVSSSSLETVINPMDGMIRRTISAPVSIPQTFLDSSSLNGQDQMQQLTWEDEIQNLYNMESFASQPYTGFLETGHVKMEM